VYICQGQDVLQTKVYVLTITNPGCGIAANHVFVRTAGSIVRNRSVPYTVNTLEQSLVCAVPFVVVSLNAYHLCQCTLSVTLYLRIGLEKVYEELH